MQKRFIEEQQLLEDSYRLARQIYCSGFRPDFIVGVWRGGSAVGIYVQECLQTLGVDANHFAIRTSYKGQPDYAEMVAEPESRIRVHGTSPLSRLMARVDALRVSYFLDPPEGEQDARTLFSFLPVKSPWYTPNADGR